MDIQYKLKNRPLVDMFGESFKTPDGDILLSDLIKTALKAVPASDIEKLLTSGKRIAEGLQSPANATITMLKEDHAWILSIAKSPNGFSNAVVLEAFQRAMADFEEGVVTDGSTNPIPITAKPTP